MGDHDQLEAGTVIDARYRVERLLGRGGFACVYEAQHLDLGRTAALKVLSIESDEKPEFLERFLREGQIIARLSHPSIVSIYDFGVHEPTGQPYLAMELLRGHDLEQELSRNGPLSPERAQHLFVGVLDALHAAHKSGVVHKDLKPSNLFLADPGTHTERLLLLDFGIAWSAEAASRLTKVGAFSGTPAYVAPEYAKHNLVSPAIDIYQTGLILAEALTGRPVVDASTAMATILRHFAHDLEFSPAILNSDFGAIVQVATALEPSDRFESADAFARALLGADPTTFGDALPTADFPPLQPSRRTQPEPQVPTIIETPPTQPRPRREPVVPSAWERRESLAPLVIAALLVAAAVGYAAMRVIELEEPTPMLSTVDVPTPPVRQDDNAPAPDAGAVEFRITSIPPGAQVSSGRRVVGRTPVTLRGDEIDGAETTFQFRLDGHRDVTRSAKVVAGGSVEVRLSRAKSSSKPVVIERISRGTATPTTTTKHEASPSRATASPEELDRAFDIYKTQRKLDQNEQNP